MTDTAASTGSTGGEVDLTGRQIADYQILRHLGRGAMAEVYLAEQISLRRKVAFKVLKSSLAHDETYVRRFQNEAQSAAALVHANIVQIYEVGCVDNVHFIAQEYVEGPNLAQLISKQGPLDIPMVLRVMRQVAAALTNAAEQGIVHRDIKPENIMVSRTGEVKTTDFGLARVMNQEEGKRLTQVGITMGTPLYMSPEQVEGKSLDPRSDIYSLGVTCYQLLAARPPFDGETALSVAVQHLQTEPVRLEEVRPDVPVGLCCIVHKMLAKDPEDRHASAVELLRDLRELRLDPTTENWPEEWNRWTTSELAALGTPLDATQKLAAVMRTQAFEPASAVSRRWLWAGVAAAFVVGGLAAWMLSERSLLEGASAAPSNVQKFDTAQQQYAFAMYAPSEEAWQSVIDYFGEDEQYRPLARRQLANVYLNADQFDEALRIFDDFAQYGDTEPEHHAFGLAGQFVAYSFDRRQQQAAAKRVELWPHLEHLDPSMMRRVRAAVELNRGEAGRQELREIDEWLEKHLGSDEDLDLLEEDPLPFE